MVVALGAFLRVYRIGAQPLWLDEAVSLRIARESLPQIWSWSTLADPGNPPLYYTLLHGWLVFGDSEGSLRLLSAVFGVLTIPLVYALGLTIRHHRLGIVAALLFAISPFQVRFSQEARGYSLLACGATLAMLGVAQLLRHPERSGVVPGARGRMRRRARREGVTVVDLPPSSAGWAWLAYVSGTTIALLAHNTAVFLPIGANLLMLGLWLMRRRRPQGFLRNWLVAQFIVLLLWATWLPAYLQQLGAGAYSWIPHPTVRTVRQAAFDLAGTTGGTPFLAEAILIVILVCLGVWSLRQGRRWLACVLVFGLTAPIGELVISVWRPIFLTRTLIWVGVPLGVTIAAGLLVLRPRVLVAGVLVALVATAALGLRSYYFLFHKEAWDRVAAYVDQQVRPGDAIFFVESYVQVPFDHYHSPPPYSIDEIGITASRQGLPRMLDEAKRYNRVWLVVSHARLSADLVFASLESEGHLVGLTSFNGVGVYLFDRGG